MTWERVKAHLAGLWRHQRDQGKGTVLRGVMMYLAEWKGVTPVLDAWKDGRTGEFGPRDTCMRTDGRAVWFPGLDFPIVLRVCPRCDNTWVVDPVFVLRSHIPSPRGAFWWQFAYAAIIGKVKYTSRLAPDQMSRALEMIRGGEVVCGCADANCTCEVCQAIREAAPQPDGVLH